MKNKPKKRKKPRNAVLAVILKLDPRRLKERIVKPEKGKGRKDRPRKKNWLDSSGQDG